MSDDRPTRAEIRAHGERSASLARTLMNLKDEAFGRIDLDEELRDEIAHSRGITNLAARRREERRLAGVLRDAGLDEVEAAVAKLEETRHNEARNFQKIERWRKELIEGDDDAITRFVEATGSRVDEPELRTMVSDARSEVSDGRPKGAGKRLFRFLREAL